MHAVTALPLVLPYIVRMNCHPDFPLGLLRFENLKGPMEPKQEHRPSVGRRAPRAGEWCMTALLRLLPITLPHVNEGERFFPCRNSIGSLEQSTKRMRVVRKPTSEGASNPDSQCSLHLSYIQQVCVHLMVPVYHWIGLASDGPPAMRLRDPSLGGWDSLLTFHDQVMDVNMVAGSKVSEAQPKGM